MQHVRDACEAFELCGDPYQLGLQHGILLRERIKSYLDDGLSRINRILHQPASLESLRPTIRDYGAVIADALPDLDREIAGLAAGARISLDEAVLLQIRREILGYTRIPVAGDCTTFAVIGRRGPVLAQTVDLNGNLEDQLTVFRMTSPHGDRQVLLLTFTGLLGYLGINSLGLAIGLNLVLGGRWRPGIPPYLAIRHLLDVAGDVDDAIEILSRLPLASSRSLTLCDMRKAATVEILEGEIRVTSAPQLAHTNHYLDAGFSTSDQINVFARNASRNRLEVCEAALKEIGGDGEVENYFEILSKHPICVHAEGNIRREGTVAAVVMRPALGEMHVRKGAPCAAPTRSFALKAEAILTSPMGNTEIQ